MRVITSPTATLISSPTFHPHPKYQLPPHGNDAESIIAMGGKGCYDSYGLDGRSVPAHIDSLVGSGHGSVLEHAHIGVFIEGVSRGCSHEIVRHRHFNYSQRSTRYTDEQDAAIVLDPFYSKLWDKYGEHGSEIDFIPDYTPLYFPDFSVSEYSLLKTFFDTCLTSFTAYSNSVTQLVNIAPGQSATARRKWARGKARQLLPHALETRLLMTGNIRAWRDFIAARTHHSAEPEIRRLAHVLWPVLSGVAPHAFAAGAQGELVDGFAEITFPLRKV